MKCKSFNKEKPWVMFSTCSSTKSLLPLLNRCQSPESLKSIHAQLILRGSITSSDLVLNKLLRLYSRFCQLDHASKLFDGIPHPNAYHWTALIHGCVESHKYEKAFSLFRKMLALAEAPLIFTVASVCKGLARQKRVRDGESLYAFVLKCGFSFDLNVQNAVLDLFMRCGRLSSATWIFNDMAERDVVSWNVMISGYVNNGRVEEAREFFDMSHERDAITWMSMLNGYVKAGDMGQARILFERMPTKNLASYNVMISGYMDSGNPTRACHIFELMPVRDVGTWNLMLLGFKEMGDIESAKGFFDKMPVKNVVSWNIMLDGYSKARDVDNARCLFDQMPEKNTVSWSAMIGGYARNGEPSKALELYRCFKEQGTKPDDIFILGIITAGSQLGILDIAELMVQEYMNASLFSNLRLVTGLIDMYAKCGSIERALEVFEMIPQKDLLCYSTMIQAFANHGLSQHAITLFNAMLRVNIKPDEVAFLGLLSACNHGGLVNDGRKYFKEMIEEHHISPTEKHYSCIIDLLGRAGCLDEAYNIIHNMPMKPNAAVWGPLLAASRAHGNVEVGEVAAAELFKIEPNNPGNYVLLCYLYAAAARWDDVAKVRKYLKELNVKRSRASSCIELGSVVYEFVMGDLSHIDSEVTYFILELLNEDMKLFGLTRDSWNSELPSVL